MVAIKGKKRRVILWPDGEWVARNNDYEWLNQFSNVKAQYETVLVPKDWDGNQIQDYLELRRVIGEGVWL